MSNECSGCVSARASCNEKRTWPLAWARTGSHIVLYSSRLRGLMSVISTVQDCLEARNNPKHLGLPTSKISAGSWLKRESQNERMLSSMHAYSGKRVYELIGWVIFPRVFLIPKASRFLRK